eukprot:CAMPEP_0204035614 /NCGR_PEP_ID=MMETSP0360-20130528/76777_1 /ASSEMBLY_ACC=CAM_ASM_000342 /TAXON_ID=268821 /ORGANISM="Scrippsiella Hangoei, Strain SHTV-5" /LENGTH=49 /DNA_ID= /DNA_START= /DNA_END= /DNA_ORIENTATION=
MATFECDRHRALGELSRCPLDSGQGPAPSIEGKFPADYWVSPSTGTMPG